ncbi:diguanylate phosphodiesterase [Leptolyngbya sp. Heron Island J]|uniref:EAL domain-containing protein n=1 Tax=Leptolyngbya sp. Heron Island J TaxID=1385935 RepID=UPI0003B93E0D|nr:EAL domain-containing protein [Leptolyngbya sp. Heron Island J]ESA36734.1 diguanylate phosphodiesterase [Leptolyngbya sp. Heron Island J]
MANWGSSSALKHFQRGETIFSEGDPGDWAYIIESGRVEVAVSVDGRLIPLRILTSGDVLGEMAVMDTAPRSASAKALEETVCVAISSRQISERVQEADPIVKLLMDTLLHRIRSTPQVTASKKARLATDFQPQSPAENNQVLDKMRLESELRAALDHQQLRPHYQPLVNIQTRQILGFEALMRWFSPTRGHVSPGEFTSIAEETSLIIPIGQHTLQQACRDLSQLQRGCPGWPLFMSINVAPRQLAEATFLGELQTIIDQYGLQPSQIKLEVTERVFMENPVALEMLQACRQAGFYIALDDFGTGFSSLNYLTRFEVDGFKIDRAFVQEILTNQRTQVLLESMLALAHGLGMETVVEGIETLEQLTVLQQAGCDIGQGYLFGKPLPFAQIQQLLAQVLTHNLVTS